MSLRRGKSINAAASSLTFEMKSHTVLETRGAIHSDSERKVKRRDDKWLCVDPRDACTVMHTKLTFMVVLGVLRVKRAFHTTSHVFSQNFTFNDYTEAAALVTVVKSWIDVINKFPYRSNSVEISSQQSTHADRIKELLEIFHIDWFYWLIIPSGVILCPDIVGSRIFYVHIYILWSFFLNVILYKFLLSLSLFMFVVMV